MLNKRLLALFLSFTTLFFLTGCKANGEVASVKVTTESLETDGSPVTDCDGSQGIKLEVSDKTVSSSKNNYYVAGAHFYIDVTAKSNGTFKIVGTDLYHGFSAGEQRFCLNIDKPGSYLLLVNDVLVSNFEILNREK